MFIYANSRSSETTVSILAGTRHSPDIVFTVTNLIAIFVTTPVTLRPSLVLLKLTSSPIIKVFLTRFCRRDRANLTASITVVSSSLVRLPWMMAELIRSTFISDPCVDVVIIQSFWLCVNRSNSGACGAKDPRPRRVFVVMLQHLRLFVLVAV